MPLKTKYLPEDLVRANRNRKLLENFNLTEHEEFLFTQMMAQIDAYEQSFSILKEEELLNPVEWADKFAYVDGKKWMTRPSQRGILLAAAHPDVEKFFLQKMSQYGASAIMGILIIYFCAILAKDCAYFLPTDGEAKSQSKRFASIIRSMPHISRKLLSGSIDKENGYNTIGEKHWMHDAMMYMRGGTSPERFQRIPLQIAFLDEPDRADDDIGDEGGWLGLVDGRFNEQGSGKVIMVGTPTLYGKSAIEDALNESDGFIFERWVPCINCDFMQTLEWGNANAKYGIKWDKSIKDLQDAQHTVHYVCQNPKCRHKMKFGDLYDLDSRGEWRCPSRNIAFDDTTGDGDFLKLRGSEFNKSADAISDRDEDRAPMRMAMRHSKTCCGLFSNVPWGKGWYKWQKAIEVANQGQPQKLLKPLHNTYFGITHKKESVNTENVDFTRRIEVYRTDQMPQGTQMLTVGADFQKRYMDFELMASGYDRQSFSMMTGPIFGKTKSNDNPALKDLYEICTKKWPVAGGGTIGVKMALLDEGYGTSYIREFCGQDPFLFYAYKGIGRVGHPLFKWPKEPDDKTGCFTINVGVHEASALLYHYLNAGKGQFGHCTFPKNEQYDEDFFKQLVSNQPVMELRNGIEVEVYAKENEKDSDEKHDCRKMNNVCVEVQETIFGFNFIKLDTIMKGAQLGETVETKHEESNIFVPQNNPSPYVHDPSPPATNNDVSGYSNPEDIDLI